MTPDAQDEESGMKDKIPIEVLIDRDRKRALSGEFHHYRIVWSWRQATFYINDMEVASMKKRAFRTYTMSMWTKVLRRDG